MADLDITASLNSEQFIDGLIKMQKEAKRAADATEKSFSLISGGLKLGLLKKAYNELNSRSDQYAETLGDAEEAAGRFTAQIEKSNGTINRIAYAIDQGLGAVAAPVFNALAQGAEYAIKKYEDLAFAIGGSSRAEIEAADAQVKAQKEAAARRDAARTGLGALEKTVAEQALPLQFDAATLERMKVQQQTADQLAEIDKLTKGLTLQEQQTLEVDTLRRAILDNQARALDKIDAAEQLRLDTIQQQADAEANRLAKQQQADADRLAKFQDQLDIAEQQNEIGLLRLRGLKDEADRQELILKYEREMEEIRRNGDISVGERAQRLATLTRQRDEELRLRGQAPVTDTATGDAQRSRFQSIASGLAGTIALAGLFGGGASAVVEQKKTNRVLDASLKELQAIKVAIQGGSARFA